MGKVYFLTDGENIKIGFTKNEISKRIKQLNTGSAKKIWELGYVQGTIETEQLLHKLFGKERIRNNGEWFLATDELIDYINKYNEKPNVYIVRNEFFNNQIMAVLSIKK